MNLDRSGGVMRLYKAIHKYASVAVLIGVVTFFGVESAQASIATDTAEALASNPDGGHGLELAIADIFDGYKGKPLAIVREILRAAADASDEQMVAIGRALAAEARELAATDPAESRAVVAAALAAQHPALLRIFRPAGGPRPPDLFIPTGGDGGGFDTTSPN